MADEKLPQDPVTGAGEGEKSPSVAIASTEELENELRRISFNGGYIRLLRSTLRILLIVAAASVLIASLFLPVMQIYKGSMEPLLCEGDIAVSVKTRNFSRGDIIGFYYSNKVLVKRVIAVGGDVVALDENGVFTVNGEILDEPYIENKAYGNYTDIEFPFTVPEGSYFVAGDNREDSSDSRSSDIGAISEEDVIGKIFFVVWPLRHFGRVR